MLANLKPVVEQFICTSCNEEHFSYDNENIPQFNFADDDQIICNDCVLDKKVDEEKREEFRDDYYTYMLSRKDFL